MAPYWSRACLKSIIVAFQVCPVTARVGAFTVRPCSRRGERSLTASDSMSAAKSQSASASSGPPPCSMASISAAASARS